MFRDERQVKLEQFYHNLNEDFCIIEGPDGGRMFQKMEIQVPDCTPENSQLVESREHLGLANRKIFKVEDLSNLDPPYYIYYGRKDKFKSANP